MDVQINDCTIRDGGYLLAKNPPPEYVRGVFAGLLESGIDVIEIGFLQDAVGSESVVYGSSAEARRFMPDPEFADRFAGFCDNSRYSLENLDACDGRVFEYLKISFAKHEADEALEFVAGAKAKGYKVFCNPMDAPSYTSGERSTMIARVNDIAPYCFSIVDTFGTMYLGDLRDVFVQVDAELDTGVRIGLHSHNNLQLSSALAEAMIDMAAESDRDLVVDASLYSMGRGAGNASTEVIASFLNERYGCAYDVGRLFDTIDEWVAPLRAEVVWGYDLPMLACGELGAHVDNVFHMQEDSSCTAREMWETLAMLEPQQRKRYGKGYSKTDFTLLDAARAERAGKDEERL